MAKKSLPDIETVRNALEYFPETGKLLWKHKSPSPASKAWNTRWAGKEAFTYVMINGYKQGAINNQSFYAHRVCWAIANGRWPDGDIDHINGCRVDNRIDNLREVSRSVNMMNFRGNKTNTSGQNGVCWEKRRNKWWVTMGLFGRHVHIGYFDDFDEAVKARIAAQEGTPYTERHGHVSKERAGK